MRSEDVCVGCELVMVRRERERKERKKKERKKEKRGNRKWKGERKREAYEVQLCLSYLPRHAPPATAPYDSLTLSSYDLSHSPACHLPVDYGSLPVALASLLFALTSFSWFPYLPL